MPVTLPKLQRAVGIVNKDGAPTQNFQQWWQSVAKAIEAAVLSLEDTIQQVVDILVRLGLVEETASGALELAESAINPNGTIKDDKVLTQSMVAEAASAGYYVQLASPIVLPDGVDTEILQISFTKELGSVIADPAEGSSVTLDTLIRVESTNDIKGELRFWRGGGPGVGTMIDSMERNSTYNAPCKVGVAYKFVDEDAPAGPTIYVVSFERNGGASEVSATPGSLMDALERKR